jgi:hypothetical protein
VNLAQVKVEGYDIAIAYGFETADLFSGDYGRVDLSLDASNIYNWKLQSLPGQSYPEPGRPDRDRPAEVARPVHGAVEEGSGLVGLGGELYRPDGRQPGGHLRPAEPLLHQALLPPRRARAFDVNEKVNLRRGVLNLMDETPALLPETYTGTGSAGAGLYDNRGRLLLRRRLVKY